MASSLKKCSSCSNELPKTQENFYVRDKAKGTLRNECINCFKKKRGRKNKKLAIYRITSPSGKIYIGKDQYFPNRMINHFHISENKKKTEHNSPIHKAIRKYGWENMIVEGVDFNAKTTDEFSHREEIWIWLCNSHKRGYNQTKGFRYYQEKFAREIGGKVEVVMRDGTRCDILTATHAIEVDFAKKWAEGDRSEFKLRLTHRKKP